MLGSTKTAKQVQTEGIPKQVPCLHHGDMLQMKGQLLSQMLPKYAGFKCIARRAEQVQYHARHHAMWTCMHAYYMRMHVHLPVQKLLALPGRADCMPLQTWHFWRLLSILPGEP